MLLTSSEVRSLKSVSLDYKVAAGLALPRALREHLLPRPPFPAFQEHLHLDGWSLILSSKSAPEHLLFNLTSASIISPLSLIWIFPLLSCKDCDYMGPTWII